MSNFCNVWGPLANESIPLKHLLGWGLRGGDLTLNSLLRTWLSLKHPLSFWAFKQLECMAKSRVSFWWTYHLHYVSSIWTSCDKENLRRVFKLQKRAARVISPKFNRVTKGGRSFAVSTCQLWNSLSLDLRNAVSIESFKNNYRNILFKEQQELV